MSGTLFVVAAASGTGKTSLVKAILADTPNLHVSVSHTTRGARVGEVDGVHYHFVSPEVFTTKILAGDFIEHAEVFGNFYGTSQSGVVAQLAQSQDVLLEIDWQGAQQVKRLFTDAVLIFIIPPSREALRERLSNRGQDSSDVIETRLAGALNEMRQHVNFDYLIVNDDFVAAKQEMQAVIIAQRCRSEQQCERHAALLLRLLDTV